MIRRLHRPIATWLSTNHPVLWVTRVDVAVAMAVAVAVVSVPIVWAASTITAEWTTTIRQINGSMVAECTVSFGQVLYGLQVLTLGLGAVATFLWFGAVYRSAYKAVAPTMRIYPRIVDLFAALAVVGLATATATVAVEFVANMNRGECPVAGREVDWGEGRLWVNPPRPWLQPMEIVGRYLGYMIEPGLILAMLFALILRWSLVAALALTAGPPIIAFAGVWLAATFFGNLHEGEARPIIMGATFTLLGLACLFMPLWAARSGDNTRIKRVLVGLSIPTCLLAVAALEYSFGTAVDQLSKRGYVLGFQQVFGPRWLHDYEAYIFFIVHSVVSLFFMQWIYVRWARMSLRPE